MTLLPRTEEEVLHAIIGDFLARGAKAHDDAAWLVGILGDADLQAFFREQVLQELERKAGGSPVKKRKLFYGLGNSAKAIFGPEYVRVKKTLDAESRAAVRKTDNQKESLRK